MEVRDLTAPCVPQRFLVDCFLHVMRSTRALKKPATLAHAKLKQVSAPATESIEATGRVAARLIRPHKIMYGM